MYPARRLNGVDTPQVGPGCAGARPPPYSGLTQEWLADKLGVTPRYLAGIERGERSLTLDSVDALAEQLGVAAQVLLDPAANPG